MIKLKNLLAENKQRILTEALLQAPNLSLNVPAQNAPNQNIPFSLGPLGKNAANEYTGILTGMTIGGIFTNSLTNQKLAGEYITGEISLRNTDANYLQLRDAILKVPANYIGTQADLNRNNANLVTKQDPNNPKAPKKNELVLLGTIKVQQTATPK